MNSGTLPYVNLVGDTKSWNKCFCVWRATVVAEILFGNRPIQKNWIITNSNKVIFTLLILIDLYQLWTMSIEALYPYFSKMFWHVHNYLQYKCPKIPG